ncbi:F-box only protein 22-like [Dreissena polymorpha]|uniref:F-box domain-containing protein n=1 Tax=Dreissena polymorpha TaxID=45954 RepID=A0A9D4KCA7_DREPO|nr:F-box only protein 22-like [Dreissena polymorpha]KAH3836764.1 hypothetical protein DPMN_110139 [Dreissena polymorpha]
MATKTKQGDFREIDVSQTLTSVYPVVELVLSFLPYIDLYKSARVCQLWRKIVNTIKLKRNSLGFSCSTREDSVWNTMRFLRNLFSEPQTLIAFCHNSMNTSLADLYVKRGEELAGLLHISEEVLIRMSLMEFIKLFVPKSCEVAIIEAAGIVGTTTDMKTEEFESAEAITFLSIPKLHNNEGLKVVTQSDVTTIEDILLIHDSKTLKACFLFCSDPGFLSKSLVSNLVDKHSVLVAGAFVAGLYSQSQRNEKHDFITCMSLSLYGNQVETASVILPQPKNWGSEHCEMTKADIEKSIITLKDMNLPDKNSFALMIACVGRGEGLFEEPNVESSLFRKHFPRTPLFGLFGDGEIGCNFHEGVLNKPSTEERKRKSPPKLFHSYTTVLVLVCVK